MSGATRFFLLLSTAPLPLLRLHLRRPSFLRLARHTLSTATYLHHPLAPLKASHQFHTQTSGDYLATSSLPHPWPHWSELVNNLSAAGYFHRQGIGWEDELLGDLPDGFVRAANACLVFARERPDILGKLPRRDIEVVVENGIPFLFRNAEESANRMRAFLCSEDSKVLVSDEAHLVDLMRFLLSYASSPIVSSEKQSLYNFVLVESSVQNLFSELVKLSYSAPESQQNPTVQNQFLDGYGQTPKTLEKTIEMKRGDWICHRCTFMNFSRNVECRECQETRPKRQLTGGEWTCPQCDYYNHGKNLVCLRCDCKRPGHVSLGYTNSRSGLDYSNEMYANNADVDSPQLGGTSDKSSTTVDEGFPEIMPLRKGVNRFVVSTRKTPLERRLVNARYTKNLDSDISSAGNDLRKEGVNNRSVVSGQSAGANSTSGGSNYVPFVPLPAERFAKKTQNPQIEEKEKAVTDNQRSANISSSEQKDALSGIEDPGRSRDGIQLSKKPVNQPESKGNEREGTEKSERWFKRIAELHNVEDLGSAMPDEDFPEIMPMRKGENRFVVNNKKGRSLTSPMYKRRMAMEQRNNNNYVPFVPLPADYFAKKDKPQPVTTDQGTREPSSSATQEKLSERSDESRSTIGNDIIKKIEKQPLSTGSGNSISSMEKLSENKIDSTSDEQTTGNLSATKVYPQTSNKGRWSSGYEEKDNPNETTNLSGSSTGLPENQNSRAGWTGKSLEGSAVKEPDPLDMSEEAKAERWFRRVAQIKDISELSQIPDEDFPSIMPMRKGVNRFVVSKRKTPLERRLTSTQYRKNLPTVNSDPQKNENEGS